VFDGADSGTRTVQLSGISTGLQQFKGLLESRRWCRVHTGRVVVVAAAIEPTIAGYYCGGNDTFGDIRVRVCGSAELTYPCDRTVNAGDL
jgi:hypothetical protein